MEELISLFEAGGVRTCFSGHEHNFQHSRWKGIDYFISGAGSKIRSGAPGRMEEAHTVSWAPVCHFLLVTIADDRMIVRAIGESAEGLTDIERFDVDSRRIPAQNRRPDTHISHSIRADARLYIPLPLSPIASSVTIRAPHSVPTCPRAYVAGILGRSCRTRGTAHGPGISPRSAASGGAPATWSGIGASRRCPKCGERHHECVFSAVWTAERSTSRHSTRAALVLRFAPWTMS